MVLKGLCLPPFEPLHSHDLWLLFWKTTFLLAVTSAKPVSEFSALSMDIQCIRFGDEDRMVCLLTNLVFESMVLARIFISWSLVL